MPFTPKLPKEQEERGKAMGRAIAGAALKAHGIKMPKSLED
jgi:hypothetical protein